MTASGTLYADGAMLRGITAGGGADDLGTHIATKDLNMADHQVLNISSITVTGNQGIAANRLAFVPVLNYRQPRRHNWAECM